jgi:phosphate/sulfate permease
MSDVALPGSIEPALHKGPDLDRGFHPLTGVIYMGVVAAALLFVAYSIYVDVDATGTKITNYLPYLLLFVALLIALGFEFVNGFHDTANAVATVIYTRSLPANIAVVWSGMFNLFGVLLSSGAVAFGIVSLLPVELILQDGCEQRHRKKAAGYNVLGNPRPAVTNYVAQHQINEGTYPSLAVLVRDISNQVTQYGSLAKFPADAVGNTRNDMYLASEAIRFLMKDKESELSGDEIATLNSYKGSLDSATKFIPTWVKIAVAIALGLGTMIGWKRIVVTVGEKIGKTHLTYAQGACAEITAAATIAAADGYGLPVSTTHVLSSGIAGTMAANGSGLQWSTIRNIATAWVLTLPAAMVISGLLYYVFSHLF